VTTGSLPPGLTLDSGSGTISGTPTTAGTYSFTAQVTDANGATASQALSIQVTQDPNSTVVTCSPGTVTIGQATTCTAVVTDTASSPTTPTGAVAFTSDTSGGTFSNGSCTLSPGNVSGQASCSLTYTPGRIGSGTQNITASYGGDAGHGASSGQAAVTVTLRTTTTVVACQQANSGLVECTATVSDTSPGSATAPTGTVSFSNGVFNTGGVAKSGSSVPSGGVLSAPQCTLTGSGTSASCTVSRQTPTGVWKTQTITATYNGDVTHKSSTGNTTLT
jgi:large repetitive protein